MEGIEEIMKVENQEPKQQNEGQTPEAIETNEPEVKEVQEAEKPESVNEQPEVKKEEKKNEKPEGDQAEATVNVEELKQELAEAIEKGKQVETLNIKVEEMNAQIEAKDKIINEYEGLLQNLVDTKMSQVPDQYKDLVPDNMNLQQKLSWLEKAESKGLFTKEERQTPAIEVGKPMNVEVPKPDTSKMSASALLSMAYNTIKK